MGNVVRYTARPHTLMDRLMRRQVRDGLTDWHREHVFVLLTELLSHRRNPDKLPEKRCPQLIEHLSRALDLPTAQIAAAGALLTVCRTASGSSFHRREDGESTELCIDFGGLETFEGGAQFEEYARFSEDPVIGDRWVQNIDEAIIATLGHELTHYLVAQAWPDDDPPAHGEQFQQVYRLVRGFGVNPMLDEFAATEAQRVKARHQARLISKVQALRKMAEDPSSNANEAERALSQLQGLQAKYGLTQEDSGDGWTPHYIERGVPVLSRDRYKPLLQLCFAIASFCGVEAVIHSNPLPTYGSWSRALGREKTIERVTYFGAPADVEMAVYLSEVAYHAVFQASERYRQSPAYQRERQQGHHPRTLLFSFRREFVDRLNRRLREARESVENEWLTARSDGRALVTARDQALRAALTARYPRLRSANLSRSGATSIGSAANAGRRAADQVNLNRPVGGRRPRALPPSR